MKLLTAQDMQAWDVYTMQTEPISSVDLMERAATRCVEWLLENRIITDAVKIFCGKGNNGGDGLVIARQLIEKGYAVDVYILELGAIGTEDFQTNLHRLQILTEQIYFIENEMSLPIIEQQDLVIDAIFGSGLNRPLQDLSAVMVNHINNYSNQTIAIDVPSGMSIDKTCKDAAVVKATYTLTFQTIKLCFLVAENAIFFGDVQVLDIGLNSSFLEIVDAFYKTIDQSYILKHLRPRSDFAHKGIFGHALLVAGNEGKLGASVMATNAALRTGCGLLTINIAKKFADIIHTTNPEAMVMLREDGLINLQQFSAIGIGCGLGTQTTSEQLLEEVIATYNQPIVFDADALNILSVRRELWKQIPLKSVLTPHPKEFDRLFGNCENDFERIQKALQYSIELGVVIVLKVTTH